jgi:hypothetical protein
MCTLPLSALTGVKARFLLAPDTRCWIKRFTIANQMTSSSEGGGG